MPSVDSESGFFPLSAAQLNIYFAQKLAPQVPFTIAQYVEIRGVIDPAVLIRATDIACRELESPLVRLGERDGKPYQWYDANVPYAMIHRDLRGEFDPVGYAQRYMDEQYRNPVDLVRDQLIASEIIQVGDAHFYWYSRAHHVVMDGLGAISVQERTAAVYTALVTGTDVPRTRAVGVRDIYDYEAAYPGSSRYEADRDYWLGRLDGHADAPRLARSSSVPSGVSVGVGAVLDAEITDAIAEVARRYNSSDVPVVLAAFSLYLARMTDTDDVMLSLPVSGRATTKLRDSSGMMSNVVPLRIGVENGVTVEELLRRVQVELTGALRHQRFRVEDMQRAAGDRLGGAAGRGAFGPTVNIMMYDSTIRLGDVVGDYRVLSSGPIDDMMVNVYPGVAGASTRVDFLGNPAVYSTEELAAHHARFLDLLRELVAAPEGTPVSALDVLGGHERDALLYSEASATVEPATLASLLPPEDHVAAQLIRRGAGPEVRVAVAMERSELSVRALCAVAGAGASYVPVDPRDPVDRLAAMLADAGVAFGLTTRDRLGALPDGIDWVAFEDLLDADAVDVVRPDVRVDTEAYLVHTSGSTGKPKAVSVTHRGLAQLAHNVASRYAITATSRVLHLASPVFDASIQEILGAYAAGAALVVAPAEVYAGPALADLLHRERVTHLITSPTVLATLEPTDLAGVEVLDVGGEDCPPALRDRFAAGDAVMLDAYGPTEATVLATLSTPMAPGERITIGAPLPGVRALVLDAHLRPAPHGGVGELYLGGDGLARGYAGQPGATAARFVADPGAQGERLYRTGDVVRWAVDGSSLEFLGRNDHQIQLRGRRVELGEIESVAAQSPGVTAAVATVRDDHLLLYITGSAAGLDAHLRSRLPASMVPARVVELDAIPMTAGGKVDRRALPGPPASATAEYVAPETATERRVAEAFADVLDVDVVGREHTFFELGGDSLSATRVIARLGPGLSLPQLFDAPSVAAVAAALDSSAAQPSSLELLDTVLPEHIPLSYAQQRMWFLNQFDSSSPAYNMPVALRLAGTDQGVLTTALRDVLERHESLRTYFPDDGDGPRQVVRPTDRMLTELETRSVAEDELESIIAEMASTGFDVAADVPMRAAILSVRDETVVVVVLHHISIDGWSVDPLVRDFAFAHAARSAGHAPTWSRLPVQYGHYAVWNRAVVDAVAGDQLDYWTAVLGGDDAPLAELPTDRPRPAVQSMRTGDVPFSIDTALHARLREVARAANATTFMVLHAALAATLSRYSGATRTVIGTPSAGRGHEALDEMVGMFVGTIPLAVTVDPACEFVDLLADVRHVDVEAFAHAELPFERIVDALATDRSLDRHPLFQVMLAFDNAPHRSARNLPVEVLPAETNTSEFDLNVVVTETPTGIEGSIEYAHDLYDHPTVDGFAATLLTVLHAVADNPHTVVGDLELGPAPRAAQPVEAGTLLDVLRTGELVAAGRVVDSVAIDGSVALSYYELELRSNRFARLLVAHGAGPEVTVALSMERSAEYIVALWAVAKSGAAFVPVDPHYPAPRRRQMLTGTTLGVGGDEDGVFWVSESDALTYSDAPIADADRIASLHPSHPAYVIHTSGSTGTPKPVTVTHAAVYALAQQVIPRYDVRSDSRVLHGYSVNFDAAVLELVLAFGAGATMVVAPTDLVDGDAMASYLVEQAVTHYLSTPAVLATVPPTEGITTVAVGGDVLGADVVREWSPGRLMLNAYGPSEATVVATLTDSLDAGSAVTIGRPLDHVAALVLDTRLRSVPVGGVGELYLGGLGVARGYAGASAPTAERFVAGPDGTRLYRTGDLVRRGRDLDFRGRIDSQVQVRGVRVELGDIESALLEHPDVRGAVAAVRDGRILAWVVGIDERDAKSWLLDRLPLTMVPAAITPVDRIPVTAHGKVDAAALASPPAGHSPAARTFAEDVVLGIFADILGVDQPPADANFFVLGGDSLSATRAAARIGAALGTRVPVRMIFEAPTARRLADAVDAVSGQHTPVPAPTHRHDAREHTALAPAERRIWLQNRYDPASAAYNIAFELPLPEGLDSGVLHAAITDVVERHLPLRTVYPSTPDGPKTVLLGADIVVSGLDERHADAAAMPTEGFDLTMEPPVRLALTQNVLTVVAHHIAVDGLSLAPLARDIETALNARSAGVAPEFTPLAVDYADYRVWQHDVLDTVAADQLEYWRAALDGLPDYLDLPTGTPAPGTSAPIEFGIDAETSTALRTLAHRLGATVFVVVHAALAAVLAEASGTRDIAVGAPVSGRSDPALDDLVGMFVGTVVLRTEVDPSATFEQFVTDVRRRDLDAFAHADVPFEWVVDAVRPSRASDGHPLFDVLLAVGDLTSPTFEIAGESAAPRRIDIASTQFDLEFVVEERADGLAGRLGYSSTRFAPAVAAGLARRLVTVLELVASRPDIPLGSAEFRRTDAVVAHRDGVPHQRSLHEILAESASTWPDAIAVVDGSTTLTYAELDARSDGLARALAGAGAGPGTLVAVALPRSAELLRAVWAVAKTGAGFLPIDPTQPPARIREILADAEPVTGVATPQFAAAEHHWLTPGEHTGEFTVRAAYLDDTAYVIYTSGSTGAPKGVRVTHRGLANLVASQRELFGVTTESRVLQFASPSFDASVFEMLLAFGAGAAAVIVPAGVYAGRELEAVVERHGVTHACLTPTVLQVTDPASTPSLGVVVMAGEAVNQSLLQRWSQTASVFDAYGPTEATIMATCTGSHHGPGPVTIGGPVRGFDAAVLDDRLRPVGDDVVGELYLGGDAVAEGYAGQPGLTATRFVPNMLGTRSRRLYRTGDLVRWVNRGGTRELEYVGRTDTQVKIRGHRVELAEVESALLRQPGVEQACVTGRDGTLAAYIVGSADPRSTRTSLARTLPAFMVPRTVTEVDALPITLSGKVDAARLPAPSISAAARVAPSTSTEHLVHRVFARVLHVPADHIGVDDTFFDLGGHSLSVVQAMDTLGDELGRALPVGLLLTHPTVAALAAELDAESSSRGASAVDVLLPLRADGDGHPVFCVHPAVGIAWSYLALLGHTDRPIYGLQTPGIDGDEELPSSIEDFAERYVREIRTVQAHGPYHLLGWSLGGVIAHAIAVRLQADGDEVAMLALVDAQLRAPDDAAEFSVEDMARQLGVAGSSFEEIAAQSTRYFLTADHLRRIYRPVTAAADWVAAYDAPVFKGDAIYVAARGSRGAGQWTDLVDGHIAIHDVDAEHEDMLGGAGARVLGRLL